MPDVVRLARDLIQFNTCNPPGNEAVIAQYVGHILSDSGFDVTYLKFGDENRLHLIAEKGLTASIHPIVLSGHFDTVPIGAEKWSVDPYGGEVKDGRLFGRGSSDMKSGLAACICASIEAFKEKPPRGGIRLIFTAAEETGIEGITDLVNSGYNMGKASALIIAEPTANIPAIGHKSSLFINAFTKGITAHSSMPHLGENAIYKAAKGITIIEDFKFDVAEDTLLGFPTINVGMIQGGKNVNSVPDSVHFTIDIRSTSRLKNSEALQILSQQLGNEIELVPFVDTGIVYTDEAEEFVQLVDKICQTEKLGRTFPRSLPYTTDGAVLQPVYNNVPTVILGPGEPECAHKTDEFCYIEKIRKAVEIYINILCQWQVEDDRNQ